MHGICFFSNKPFLSRCNFKNKPLLKSKLEINENLIKVWYGWGSYKYIVNLFYDNKTYVCFFYSCGTITGFGKLQKSHTLHVKHPRYWPQNTACLAGGLHAYLTLTTGRP